MISFSSDTKKEGKNPQRKCYTIRAFFCITKPEKISYFVCLMMGKLLNN